MTRLIGLSLCALGLVACSDATRHQSTGFSGLGSEPTVSQGQNFDPRLTSTTLTSTTLKSDIPIKSVRSGISNRADHAELAIRKASGADWKSKHVAVGSQTLALSVLYVNSIPYAVLKPQAGLFSPNIVPETSAAFAANATELTGCPAISQVYAVGPQPNRPQGLTVALGCRT